MQVRFYSRSPSETTESNCLATSEMVDFRGVGGRPRR
jgi:hypothetical protein